MFATCANPAGWHPTLHTINQHHHPPLSWRLRLLAADPEVDQSWWRMVPFCGLCHDELHTLLNAYVHAGGVPAWSIRRSYSPFLRSLAAEVWERRPSDKPPYTVATVAA